MERGPFADLSNISGPNISGPTHVRPLRLLCLRPSQIAFPGSAGKVAQGLCVILRCRDPVLASWRLGLVEIEHELPKPWAGRAACAALPTCAG